MANRFFRQGTFFSSLTIYFHSQTLIIIMIMMIRFLKNIKRGWKKKRKFCNNAAATSLRSVTASALFCLTLLLRWLRQQTCWYYLGKIITCQASILLFTVSSLSKWKSRNLTDNKHCQGHLLTRKRKREWKKLLGGSTNQPTNLEPTEQLKHKTTEKEEVVNS